MVETEFNQFFRQRNQLVVAADNFLREQNLSPVLQSTMSKDCSQGDWHCGLPKQKVLRDTAAIQGGKPRDLLCSGLSIRRGKEEENPQQILDKNYKLDEFVYLLDVMNSVCDKVIANQPICNVL